ncbi:hypothetical protein [Phenylobacterium sp.]|jgi:hypothetical protein|uniref:hypothetical protein n=1 Tax=Phenylobacterium sp. TaxID=1871053 RepID=UPI0037C777BF
MIALALALLVQPTPEEAAYDARLKASAGAVRAYQGPLDGGWVVSADGVDLYVLRLTDRGGVVDGAWRDLRRPGALNASGFLLGAGREGEVVTLRFGRTTLALRPAPAGWSGELSEGGAARAATARRAEP